MSRFTNLEFGDQFEDSGQNDPNLKGEAHYLSAARAAYENGEFEPALRLYSKVLEFNPANAAAWAGQVRMLIELEEYREAKLWADKALERFAHDAELLAAKAVALSRTGDLHGAMVFSDAAIEEHGDTPYVWLARGDVLLARREARANYCFDKALLLAPRDWFVAWLAARIRQYHKQFSLALQLVQKAVELNAGNFVLWLQLGQCQQELGLLGPARSSFAQAQELNPQCQAAKHAIVELSSSGLGTRLLGFWRRFRK